jgi:hypothetical protein
MGDDIGFMQPRIYHRGLIVGGTPKIDLIGQGGAMDYVAMESCTSGRNAFYPGIVKTTLDGVDQRDYLEGKSPTSARDVFYYYSGATPSAVRYKNWKFYYSMAVPGSEGWFEPLTTYHRTQVQNIKRDPFEQAAGLSGQKTAMSLGVH